MACSFSAAMMKENESKKRRKKWVGGDIYDNVGENSHPKDSSGEPNTNQYEEEEHPMEYMAGGGLAPATYYEYQGPGALDYGPDTAMSAPKIGKSKSDDGTDMGEEEMAGPDSSDMGDVDRTVSIGGEMRYQDSKRFKRAEKMLAGGEARSREPEHLQESPAMHAGGVAKSPERREKQPRPAMYTGGLSKPGIGKGGGLKGAFEHDDDTPPPPPPPKAVKVEDDGNDYYAGGEARLPEDRHEQPYPAMHAGGPAREREPEDFEEMPHMMAGGDAALPEERHLENDSLEDVDSSFIEDFLRRKRNRMSTPG